MAGSIGVKVVADVSNFKAGMNEAAGSLAAMKKGISGAKGNLAAYAAAATAAGAAIVIGLVKSALDAADANVKLAAQLNTTSESISTLTRASELSSVSMGEIEAGSKKLAVQLGKASDETSNAAKTFDRLGLSAEALYKMPLDERIASITSAIKENIPATEQAAVSSELFGKTAGASMSLVASELERAKRETIAFGTVLNDVDAAKLDMAGDSISTFKEAAKGTGIEIAKNLAPALDALGRMLLDNAEKSGGFGSAIAKAVELSVKGLGFLADVLEGVKRAFELVANSIIGVFGGIYSDILSVVHSIISDLDRIPGVDLSGIADSMKEEMELAKGIVEQSRIAFDEILMRPMPSDVFAEYVKQSEEASKKAAENLVVAKTGEGEIESKKPSIVKTDLDKTDKEKEARAKELEDLKERFLSETELLDKKLQDDLILIDQSIIDGSIKKEEARLLEQQATAAHQAALTEIEKNEKAKREALAAQESERKMAFVSTSLSALSAIAEAAAGKDLKKRRKAAKADALISTFQGIAAGVRLGWPMAIPAVAYAAATGFAQVRNIDSQSTTTSVGSGVGGASSSSESSGGNGGGGGKTSNMFVRGINPNDMFSGSQLVDMINKAQSEGAQLRLA